MKKFLLSVTIFIIPMLVVLVCSEILLRKIPNHYSYKNKYLEKNAQNVGILILGSSHPYCSLNPQYLTLKSFNAAYNSQTINFDFEILKKYDKKWDSLKYIIEAVDYFSIFCKPEVNNKDYNIYYGINTTNDISDYSEMLTENANDNFKRIFNYYYRHKKTIQCSELGWSTVTTFEKRLDLVKTGKSNAKRHFKYKDHFIAENIEILKSMIRFAKARNVHVILLTTPAYKTYIERLDEKQLSKATNAMKMIDSLFDNCDYINLLTDTAFTKDDFFDASHLDEIGAKKLTLKIDSFISVKEKRSNLQKPLGKMAVNIH